MIRKKALTVKELVELYPLNPGTLANWRLKKQGPRFYKVGRMIVYRPEDIEEFLFKNPVLTTESHE